MTIPPAKPRNLIYDALFFLTVSWLIVFKGRTLAILLPFVLLGGLAWFGLRRKYLFVVLILVLNPLTVFFASGVKDYFFGYPTLVYMGLPSIESHNIDRQTRCFVSTGGCLVRGDEWIHLGPNNFAVRLLASVLGPPPSSYDGPYPTKEQALAILVDSPQVLKQDFLSDRLSVGLNKCQLEPGVGEKIIEGLRFISAYEQEDDPHRLSRLMIQAALHEERCLVIRLTEHFPLDEPGPPLWADYVVLFDSRIGLPFAYYFVGGERSCRFHPVSYKERGGILAFVQAARKGDKSALRSLIKKGADINRKDRVGQTALMIAAQEGHAALVRDLIDSGADLEPKDNNGYTALVNAIARSRTDVARILIEHGARVSCRDVSRMTPLMHAAYAGDLEFVKLLIQKGADPQAYDLQGNNAQDSAIQIGNAEIVQYLSNLTAK